MPKGKKKTKSVDKEEKKEEEQTILSGQWCLKYGMWVRWVQEDDLCEWVDKYFSGDECLDCYWAAWNVKYKGLPLGDMPRALYLTYQGMENNERIVDCPHDSVWIKWEGVPYDPKGEWLNIHEGKPCKCKPPFSKKK